MLTTDSTVLLVKDVPAGPEQLKRVLHYRLVNDLGEVVEEPLKLCGFGFFAEVEGLHPLDTGGIHLWSALDGAQPPVNETSTFVVDADGEESSGKYHLTYKTYLDRLRDAGASLDPPRGINLVRLFILNQQKVRHYPFPLEERRVNGRLVRKFRLDLINEDYIKRLVEFVREARARGIVVCISLCSFASLRLPRENNDPGGYRSSPFNKANNWNEMIAPDPGTEDARGAFCAIEEPPSLITYSNNWTVSQRLYFVQHQLFKRVVDETKAYWNVIYEICNEPGPGFAEVVEWHGKVAAWLNDFLRDETGSRSRLLAITPANEIFDAIAQKLEGQADIIGLHGDQWGPPSRPVNRCQGSEPNVDAIKTAITATIKNLNDVKRPYLGKFTALFDSDALYWAQRTPKPYVNEVLGRGYSFDYRWADDFIDQVNVPTRPGPNDDYCKDVKTGAKESLKILGLKQRLELIASAANFKSVTRLPRPPAAAPRNLSVAVEGNLLKLSFPRLTPAPEGYAALFGPSPDALGRGTAIFPGRQYFTATAPAFDVFFIPAQEATEVYVAVAARNGVVTGEPSNVVRVAIPGAFLNAELVAADLPVGPGRQIPDRFFSGSMTFKNTGTAVWKRDFTRAGATVTTGIYMQSREVANESGRALIPLPVAEVLPGQTVTIPVQRVLLPYSRSPLHFNMGMGMHRRFENGVAWGHFGTVYTHLNPATPIEVRVVNPRRRASVVVERNDLSIAARGSSEPFVLSGEPDFSNYDLPSVTTAATAAPGTIIRPTVRIESVAGRTRRVARVSHDGAAALKLNLKVVRLDMRDVERPGRLSSLFRSYDLAPGASAASSLARFENTYAVTSASSESPLPAGQPVIWETVWKAGAAPRKQLSIRNGSTAAAKVTGRANEMWEDLPAGEADPRQGPGSLDFAPGETVKYVGMGGAVAHRFFAAQLRTDGSVEARCSVVFRANAAGNFERVLEVVVGAHAQAVRVDYQVLNVFLDV